MPVYLVSALHTTWPRTVRNNCVFPARARTDHNTGYNDITIFDQHAYDSDEGYKLNPGSTAASVDENKVFRASYGDELYYQRLAYEAREIWKEWNKELGAGKELFVESGMLRVQHSTYLDDLELQTLANMTKEGLRDTQYIVSDEEDVRRAEKNGWAHKLLKFPVPGTDGKETFEAVLDTTAGYVFPSKACAYIAGKLRKSGTQFVEGPEKGVFASLLVEGSDDSKRAIGIVTKDGKEHSADLVIMACKLCFSYRGSHVLSSFPCPHRWFCNSHARARSQSCTRGNRGQCHHNPSPTA